MASEEPVKAVKGDLGSPVSRETSSERGNASHHYALASAEELEGLTLYEKKSLLIEKEIDSMGMGRYQWALWALCGFGYLLDLLWAEAFGLVLQPLSQELNIQGAESGNISTSFSAGLTAGAMFWGILVDIVGRRWAFNLTCLCSSVFGLGLAGSNNYNTFLVLTAFVGFGVGGNIPIDTTITLEFIPQRKRRLLPLLSIFQPVGVVVCAAIAYGFIPQYSCDSSLQSCQTAAAPCCGKQNNFGWRYTLLTVGSITMLIFISRVIFFRLRESPKFLVSRGKDAEAIKVLHQIRAYNKQQPTISLEMLEALSGDDDSTGSGRPMLGSGKGQRDAGLIKKFKIEMSRYKTLFNSWNMARLTTLVWIIYACDFWGFTIAGYYTPSILKAKGGSTSMSIYDTYRSYIYIYLPGTVGVLCGVLGYDLPRVGRKWTMVISSALMAMSLFVFATVNSQASNIGLSLMEYFFQSMFNAVLYGWTPEAFPAYIRGTASGAASFIGRLFGIVAPLAAQTLLPGDVPVDEIPWQDYANALYLGAGVAFGATVALVFLPSGKMQGKEVL